MSLLYIHGSGPPFLQRGERVSIYTFGMRQAPFSIQRRDCLSSIHRRQISSLYRERGKPPPYRGEIHSLPSLEKESATPVYRGEPLIYSPKRGESVSLLFEEETGPFVYVQRKDCLSCIKKSQAFPVKGGRVSLLYIKERQSLLCT